MESLLYMIRIKINIVYLNLVREVYKIPNKYAIYPKNKKDLNIILKNIIKIQIYFDNRIEKP